MVPIEFKHQNRIWAKDQKEYQPLPAYTDETQTISCWRLTWRERLKILFGQNLWLHQMNFGSALQPQYPTLDYPFTEVKE